MFSIVPGEIIMLAILFCIIASFILLFRRINRISPKPESEGKAVKISDNS
jgi:hypothetical protein